MVEATEEGTERSEVAEERKYFSRDVVPLVAGGSMSKSEFSWSETIGVMAASFDALEAGGTVEGLFDSWDV